MPPVVNRKEREFAVGLFASSNRIRTCSPLVSSSKRPPAQQVARRVSYVDTETNKYLVFLTNNFDLAALTITQIYKCRWQVELFFKWIKQHLRIKAFYVTSENAVKTQVWIAVSVYVLVAIVRKRPFWSPDNSSIGFFAHGKRMKIAASGGAPEILCDAPNGRGGTWGSDGTIVFAPDDHGQLSRVPASGGTPVAAIPAAVSGQREINRFPSFLTGSDRFLYLHVTKSSESSGVYLGSLRGAPPIRVLPDSTTAYHTVDPATGKDWIVFRRGSSVMAQPFDPIGGRLSGEATQLAASVGVSGNAFKGAFSASANGSLAVWPNFGGALRQLVWVDRSGRRLEAVTKPSPIPDFALSRDEKHLVMRIGGDRSDYLPADARNRAASQTPPHEYFNSRKAGQPA